MAPSKHHSVLVLLATRNGSAWIHAQLNSILLQTEVSVHVAIGDDCSSDDTVSLAREFVPRLSLEVASRKQPSGSAAQNFFSLIRAHNAENHDFVSFADQDDIWEPDKLARGCQTLARQSGAGYSSAVCAFWPDGTKKKLTQSKRKSMSDFFFEGAGQGCTFVLSADFYRRVRIFLLERPDCTDSIHYHDWTIYALSRSWNLTWVFDSRESMRYRQHPDNDTGAKRSPAGIVKRLRLIRTGWYKNQLTGIASICKAAAPDRPLLLKWHRCITSPGGIRRTFQLATICLAGGRRRLSDNAMLLFAIVAGWI